MTKTQNTKTKNGTKNICVREQLGQILDKRYQTKKPKKSPTVTSEEPGAKARGQEKKR